MMALPASMQVMELAGVGPPSVLRLAARPVPVPAAGEILIRVAAIGISRPDSLQRQGLHPPPPGASDVPGLEVAGTVAAVGERVSRWKIGDAVCALLAGGGYAEYATAPEQQVLPIPERWSAVEAASLPENMFTVWDNVFRRAHLSRGETLLVHGGTSGIGSTAIMLGRAFGAEVIATAGGEAKRAACLSIGAALAIDYKVSDFVPLVLKRTGGRGADVSIDIVGGDYVQRCLDCMAVEGRLVHLATQGPDKRATLDMSVLLKKRGTIIGSSLRWRTPDEKGLIAADLLAHVWPKLPPRDPIAPLIDSVHPLHAAAQVHAYFDSGVHVGKIILTP